MAKHVLITGCSTGIGRACVLRLAEAGWTVHAGVRKISDGRALERDGGGSIRPVELDITDAGSVLAAAQQLAMRLGQDGLAGLVNNAGICVAGPVESVPIEDWRRQFEVNVFGQISLTQAMLPLLRVGARAFGAATIVMVSSIAGRIGQPVLGPYCSSKFALEAISDALRCELAAQDIRVSLLEPGAIKSEIWRKSIEEARSSQEMRGTPEAYRDLIAGLTKIAMEAEKRAMPAFKVARQVERCLASRKPPIRVLIGADAKSSALLAKLLPRRIFDRLMMAVITRAGRKA